MWLGRHAAQLRRRGQSLDESDVSLCISQQYLIIVRKHGGGLARAPCASSATSHQHSGNLLPSLLWLPLPDGGGGPHAGVWRCIVALLFSCL